MDIRLFSDSSKKMDESETLNQKQILPFDVIIDILRWLPPKSLIKFQIVSKEWHELINGLYIVEKQRECSQYVHYLYNINSNSNNASRNHLHSNTEYFTMIRGCDGLLLMRSWSDNKYCLWNPATHRLLELPDPHKHSYEFALSYVPSSRNYRILSVHRESSGVNVYEVLTPGHSKAWRRLTFPDHIVQGNRTEDKVSLVSTGAVVHCIRTVKLVDTKSSYKEILSLDMGTECFNVTTLLKGLEKSWALDWNGKLGFGKIDGINVQVVVLEDYKKQIWGEKKSIQLPFMKDDEYKEKTFLMFAKNGDLWFWLKEKKIFTYTIGTGGVTNIITTRKDVVPENFHPYKPSMISFQGMVPDTKLQRYRPIYLR